MLRMVGFEETYESKCFNKENFNKNNIRMAVISKKIILIQKNSIDQNTSLEKLLNSR